MDPKSTPTFVGYGRATKELSVKPGKYISPDSGLSDFFLVTTSDDDGNAVVFDLEPREWLEEWEILLKADLPAGASYGRLLSISAVRFRVRIRMSADGRRHYRFMIFDITTRSDRVVTFSEEEVARLAGKVREGLTS